MKNLLGLICILHLSLRLAGQTVPYSILYDDTMVNAIYITMPADSLEEMYDVLENEHEYAVQFVYDRGTQQDTLEETGFRLRGNTSLFSAKKSFKVSFNTYRAGRTFEGAKKLNLIGNHNDPTMVREKVYFDIYNSLGLPVRRVGFVDVYINGAFYGLYTVVEEYDDIWLRDRYGDDSGLLLKCIYGSTLTYNGTNTNAYPTYEQQTNEQTDMKDELVMLTDVLNNTPLADLPCALEPIFDIDQFLKIYALDISTGHWDNYGANQNNYYLYRDQISGQFKFLSYDCDNVLGIDWFGIDWANRDVYAWNFSGRPLVERLMAIPEYRDRLTFYLDHIAQIAMDTDYWYPRLDALRDLIAPSALLDVYRTYDYGFSYSDFLDGFDTDDVYGHCPYGIKNFFAARNNATISQLDAVNVAPIIHFADRSPLLLQNSIDVQFNVFVEDEDAVPSVQLHCGYDGIAFSVYTLYDDGVNDDGLAGNNIFGYSIPIAIEGSELYYYLTATDQIGQTTRFPSCDSIVIPIYYSPPTLVINEVMADNVSTIPDNDGEYPDYIELYNYGLFSVYVGNLFISDETARPTKWRLPDILMPSNTYLLIFADNETEQGINHASFSLDAEQDELILSAGVLTDYTIIDSVSFQQLPSDTAYGRYPNGYGDFILLPESSPGAYNGGPEVTDTLGFSIVLTNNPGTSESQLILTLTELQTVSVSVYSIEGRQIFREPAVALSPGVYSYAIPANHMHSGTYLIRVEHGDTASVLTYVVL